jgi:hypothetical protein
MTSKDVSTIPYAHPQIRADDWLSPLVCRLLQQSGYTDGNKTMHFSVRLPLRATAEDTFNFSWRGMKGDIEAVRRTYQEPVITEFATLALACASVDAFAGMTVTEVLRRGERADYWLGDRELLLEVSGQQDGDLQKLHSDKAKQLKENPHEKDGYICVANYATAVAHFWYYSYES